MAEFESSPTTYAIARVEWMTLDHELRVQVFGVYADEVEARKEAERYSEASTLAEELDGFEYLINHVEVVPVSELDGLMSKES